jgi:hypothetical protein
VSIRDIMAHDGDPADDVQVRRITTPEGLVYIIGPLAPALDVARLASALHPDDAETLALVRRWLEAHENAGDTTGCWDLELDLADIIAAKLR